MASKIWSGVDSKNGTETNSRKLKKMSSEGRPKISDLGKLDSKNLLRKIQSIEFVEKIGEYLLGL